MPGLRLLLRLAPFAVGAVAAAVWLRRRRQRRALLETSAPPRAIEPPAADAEGAATQSGRTEAMEDEPRSRTGRFARRSAGAPQREPIDIVTVVDDLLLAGR